MRGKLCSVCAHRERAGIDLALARGVSVSALARRYDLSTDSIYRHRKAHIPPQLRAKLIAGPDIDLDLDRLRENESQSLLANLVALRHGLFARSTLLRSTATDPPPLKWSDLRYVFDIKEDCNGKEAIQA